MGIKLDTDILETKQGLGIKIDSFESKKIIKIS